MRVLRTAIALMVVASGASCGADDAEPEGRDVTIGSVEPDIDETEARTAVEAALGDGRLEALLENNPFTVSEVRTPEGAASGLVVVVEFDDPLDDETDYPLDVCSIDTGGSPIAAVVWLVDGEDVSAVSPRWGDDITCGL